MKLRDEIAVVTGAGSGIGWAVCRRFAAEGAVVVAVDRDQDSAARCAAELGGRATSLCVDVARPDDVTEAFERISAERGVVDVLAHIAGVDDQVVKHRIAAQTASGDPIDITSQLTDEQWRRMVSVNLDGTFYCVRAALQRMIPRRSGSIITMSSLAGVVGVAGLPHYSATKAAVLGLTRAVAKEVAAHGVRVNAIAPGGIVTPMTARSPSGMKAPVPMGRMGEADEIASVALFLASKESSYMTGETVNVNGGLVTV